MHLPWDFSQGSTLYISIHNYMSVLWICSSQDCITIYIDIYLYTVGKENLIALLIPGGELKHWH